MNETLSLINNKYLIIKELNHGEFGKIYKAKHRMSNDEVVIKIEKKMYFHYFYMKLEYIII